MDDVERMTIGEFAERAGLTPKALRLYDEMALLRPAVVDRVTGYRHYDVEQLDRARLVARLRLVGMPLARIRRVADLPAAAAAAEVSSYWRQVEADLRTRRDRVVTLVAELRAKEQTMSTTTTADAAGRLARGGRERQQDAIHLGDALWVVADGFGEPSDTADRALAAFTAAATADGDPLGVLDTAFERAHEVVEGLGGGRWTGTTLTAVRLVQGQVAVAHLGDSRAWLVRDGRLQQLTVDHTEVQSLVADGTLTEEEARSDPRRNRLNRAVAAGIPAEPDTMLVPVATGDRLVLTTDGTHAVLGLGDLAQLVSAGTPPEVADAVASAVEEAGAPDNYAVVVVDLP